MMARLTFKKWFERFRPDEKTTTICVNGYTQICEPIFLPDSIHPQFQNCYLVGEAVDKLAAYEDAEEQGLLYRLPCKIGDIVFAIVEECEDFYIPDSNYYTIYPERFALYMIEEIGKSVFLTEPEAEAALKALKEDKQ